MTSFQVLAGAIMFWLMCAQKNGLRTNKILKYGCLDLVGKNHNFVSIFANFKIFLSLLIQIKIDNLVVNNNHNK